MYPYIYIVLPSYTVMAFLGGFISLVFIYFRLERFQVTFTMFLKTFVACVIGGVAGSKILFAITQIPWLVNNFSLKNLILLIPESGFVFYGGLFGVIFTIIYLTRKEHQLRERIFRMVTPAIPLFHGFGRIGCLLAGCCYGKKLAAPMVLFGFFEIDRIPVQIIEAGYEFILFAILLLISRKGDLADLLKIYLVSYAVFRFMIEFFRGDDVRGFFVGLSTAQWVSLLILGYYMVISVRYKKTKSIQRTFERSGETY